MKLGKLFKILINILYYTFLVAIIAYPIMELFPDTFPGILETEGHYPILKNVSIYAFFIFITFILYQFRKFASVIRANKLFSNESILISKYIGTLFIIVGSTFVLIKIISTINKTNFFQALARSIPILIVYVIPLFVVGIFFLLLSDGFKKALALKEENDLTV